MERLRAALSAMNIEYTEKQEEQFAAYMDGVLAWNERVNLTAIRERGEFITKHFIDSVLCAGEPEIRNARKIIDVGTGAGFPGVPLAIVFPQKEFVLMDSLNKRLKIIKELCEHTGIKNVSTIHARAEELAKSKAHRESYDACISRAVANLSTLCEYCLPFTAKGGSFLAYKGPDLATELNGASRAIELLGGRLDRICEPQIPGFELEHKILFIKKIKETPAKYPKKAGIPSKEPLK